MTKWRKRGENLSKLAHSLKEVKNGFGHKLFFYTHYNEEKHRNDIEIDFVIQSGGRLNFKIMPIEVKSGKRYKYESLKRFREKFGERLGESYIIHPKNFAITRDGVICIPAYMAMCL